MGALRTESLMQKLENIVPKYIARFIMWINTAEDKRCPFSEFMQYEPNVKGKTLEECKEWLTRQDAIEAQKVYLKHMKDYNLMKLYESMLEKALSGDVNAAKWVENFSNSSFFNDQADEIESFLKNVNIPALKGKV
mgnify:CR=1 FL=1